MKTAGFGLLLLAMGCAGPRAQASPTLVGFATEPQSWERSEDAVALNMRAIAKRFNPAGVHPANIAFEGFLTTGARTTHRIELHASSCLMILAIASSGVHDMDAALYTAEGDLLATDSQPDPHPAIHICSGSMPRTLYYALQVYEGTGSFLVVGFEGASSALATVAGILDKQPVVARIGEPTTEGPDRLAAFRDGLQHRGFVPVKSPQRIALVTDQKLRVSVPVEGGVCYTVAAFAGDGQQNVDLVVLDEAGQTVARDTSTERDASVQFCGARHAEYAAELQEVEGQGDAVFLTLRVESAAIGGSNGLWLGERPLAEASTVPLADALAAVSRRAKEDGFPKGRTLLTGQISPGEAIASDFTLGAKRCARIDAVGGPGVRTLALRVRDEHSATSVGAKGRAESSSVEVCAQTAHQWTLELLAVSGSGPFALTLHEAPLSTAVQTGTLVAH
jgi:hypothetical protein